MRKYLLLPAMAMALTANPALAQNAVQEEKTNEGSVQSVELSAAELVETKNTIERITQADMERKGASNIFEAIKMEPGVSLSSGSGTTALSFRRSSEVNIRGFDQSRVGIFLDGIPLLNNWGREFDLARISSFNLDSIEISKGYSSVLLTGANSLGGVIDMRTAKPEDPFEFKAKYKNYFDRDINDMAREYGAIIGTRQEHFYLKASYFEKQQDFIRTSAKAPSIEEGGVVLYEKGGKHDRAESKDQQVNLAVGWTPNDDVDIMFGYLKHAGEKHMPIMWRSFSGRNLYKYDWPAWDTERTYVNADVKITDQSYLKATVYYDQHEDQLDAYRLYNGAWQFVGGFASKFDDEAWGTRLEYGYTFNDQHQLTIAGHYRDVNHTRESVDIPGFKHREADVNYLDLGAEYTYKPADPLTVVFGLSYSRMEVDSFSWQNQENFAPKPVGTRHKVQNLPKMNAFNWQLGLFYDLTPEHELHFTYARKSNLGTPQDLLTTVRDGSDNYAAIDWLDPETADHFEFGYKGDIDGWLQLQANVFYSLVRDAFGEDSTAADPQTLNIGSVSYSGYELGIKAIINEYLTIGSNLSYLKTHLRTANFSEAGAFLNERPKFMANAYLVVSPIEGLNIIPSLQAASGKYQADDYISRGNVLIRKGDKVVPGFARVDLRATYDFNEHFTLEAGVENIGDIRYAYTYAMDNMNNTIPEYEAGRSYYIGLTYTY